MTTAQKSRTQAQLLALCRLAEMPPRLFTALLQKYGSVDGIFQARDSSALDELSPGAGKMVKKAADLLQDAVALIDHYKQREIRLVTRFDADYSQLLFELNDPPPLLFVRGRMPQADRRTVAVVGSDRPDSAGIAVTTAVARGLASRSVQVVASLTTAGGSGVHLGSEAEGGGSFAVVGCGFDHIEEDGAVPLAIDVVQNGGLISEARPEESEPPHGPAATNRLIVGLAQAVVITAIYADSLVASDVVSFCHDIGKLLFLYVDPEIGPLVDETAYAHIVSKGGIVLDDGDALDTIVAALV